MLVLFVEIPTR